MCLPTPDLAAVEIQNRVKLAENRLPAEVIQNGISVEKQAPSQLMTISLTSSDPKFDEIYLSNFATINVLDLLRVFPVWAVCQYRKPLLCHADLAMPDKLANFGLTVQDLQNALKDQNRESAAGVLGQQPVQGLDITIPITTQGRLSSAKQFEDIVVRANANGSIIVSAMWRAYRSKPLLTVRKAVSMAKTQPFSASICFREPMPWKWRTT